MIAWLFAKATGSLGCATEYLETEFVIGVKLAIGEGRLAQGYLSYMETLGMYSGPAESV